jgi:hypothetical protein
MKSRRKRAEEMKRSNRTIAKQVRLSPEEWAAISVIIEDRGTDFSDLVRQLLYREIKTQKQGQAA